MKSDHVHEDAEAIEHIITPEFREGAFGIFEQSGDGPTWKQNPLRERANMNALWIILTGILVAVTAGWLGCYLVLRKMSMVGDAISHAVLPGIAIAFIISGSTSNVPMLIGAAGFGLLTTFLIETLHKKGRLQSDAAIGIVFTLLFAIGVIIISADAGNVHIDQDCVLYGEITYVPLDTWITSGGTDLGPRAIWILGAVFLIVLITIIAGYKGLFITTFDPDYAAAIGISTAFWHYLLMGLVSLTAVVSFESVGAILVVAFIIVPAATAYLLTNNLKKMLVISAIVGILASIGGYYLAVALNASIAGAMAVVLGVLFTSAFLRFRIRKFI